MLSIKANDNYLIIPDNIRISINAASGMLANNKNNNSLNFGLSSINKKYLGANHLPGIKRLSEIPVDIRFKSFYRQAILKYATLNKEMYSCSISFDETLFNEKFKEVKISELSTTFGYLYQFIKDVFVYCGYAVDIDDSIYASEYLFGLTLVTNAALLEMNIPDFIQGISDLLNIHYLINENEKLVKVVSLEETIRNLDALDITEYSLPDLTRKNEDLPTLFKFTILTDNSGENSENMSVGEGSLAVEFASSIPSSVFPAGDVAIATIFNNCWKLTANMLITSYAQYDCTILFPYYMLNNFDYAKVYQINSTLFLVEELAYNLEHSLLNYRKTKLRAI